MDSLLPCGAGVGASKIVPRLRAPGVNSASPLLTELCDQPGAEEGAEDARNLLSHLELGKQKHRAASEMGQPFSLLDLSSSVAN